MEAEKEYTQVLVNLGAVLAVVKDMHLELIGQLEALPIAKEMEPTLASLRKHAEQITHETIIERICALYPELPAEQISEEIRNANFSNDNVNRVIHEPVPVPEPELEPEQKPERSAYVR